MEAAYQMFVVPEHREYVEKMLAATNLGNLEEVYRGHQSIPRPYSGSFRIETWDTTGSIHSPRYGEQWEEEVHEEDIHYQVVVQLPEDVVEQVGGGRLVVELEVDTREEEGWEEWVEYIEGPKYIVYKNKTDKLNWTDAESVCQKDVKDGHLASFVSEEEHNELKKVATGMYYWIGLNDYTENGVWAWADGAPYDYKEPWVGKQEEAYDQTNCANWGYGYMYADWTCDKKTGWVCIAKRNKLTGNTSLALNYTAEQLNFPFINVRYHFKVPTNKTVMEEWEEKRVTGFKLRWILDGMELTTTATTATATESSSSTDTTVTARTATTGMASGANTYLTTANYPTTSDDETTTMSPNTSTAEGKYKEPWMGKMVEVAAQARGKGISRETLINTTMQLKVHNTSFLQFYEKCESYQLEKDKQNKVFDEINTLLNDRKNETVNDEDLNDEDLQTGIMVFYTIVYCNINQMKLFKFLGNLTFSEGQRTIIRSLVNTIESGKLKDIVDDDKVNGFYKTVDKVFKLNYGKILLATSSRGSLEDMVERKLPYFEPFLEELTGCLNATAPGNDTDLATENSTESFNDYGTDDYCEELRGLVATLGRLLSNR